jgi:hypothetical protein
MIRRILDFVILLLYVWGCMILGLWVIDAFIVPMTIPGVNGYVVNVIQVVISASMVLLWLLMWRWLSKSMFWRAIRNHQNN